MRALAREPVEARAEPELLRRARHVHRDRVGRALPLELVDEVALDEADRLEDLQLGRGVSIVAAYVALTRVKRRADVLIYRPFDRSPFINGPPEGPSVLMQHLRGDTESTLQNLRHLRQRMGVPASCIVRKHVLQYRSLVLFHSGEE